MNNQSNKIVFIRAFNRIQYYESITPPLGIAALITFLKNQQLDVECDFYDTAIDSHYKTRILSKYRDIQPLLFGISSMIRHIETTCEIITFLQDAFPHVPIIIGGPLVSSLEEKTLNFVNADFAIYKEGEIPLYIFIKEILSGRKRFESIPSLIYRDGTKILKNPSTDAILKAEEIPLPDLESIGLKAYFSHNSFVNFGGRRPYLSVMTSRGCPFSCIYCHNFFGKTIRKVRVDPLIEYCKRLIYKYNIKEIEILDDIFNIDEKRGKEIITKLLNINKEIKFLFPNGLRTDILSEQFIDFLGSHNTIYISTAIESGSERIQRLIKKRLDLKKARENIIRLSKYKIHLHGFFMFGFPTETEDEVKETIQYALDLPLLTASFFRVSPHPGSEIYNLLSPMQREQILKRLSELRYYSQHLNISNVENNRLNSLLLNAFIRFYLRPRQIIKNIKMVSLRGLLDGFTTFINILTRRYNE